MQLGFHYAILLPFIGAFFILSSLVQEYRGLGSSARRLLRYGSTALIIGWFVYLIPFINLDYRLAEVANNASGDLSLPMRLAASWAGGGGSLYLYTSLISLAVLYVVRSRTDNRGFRVSSAIVLLVAFASAVLNGAFDVVNGVGGFGINPLLKNYWIIPHPLTTFGGYALLLGASLILLFTGDKARGRAVFLAGWGLLSLGIAFGALWSYETLGWGGYWAWDPVEVSELTVWLAATAYLHSVGPVSGFRRSMLALTASSTLLAPFVTRSGLSPIHSFASGAIGNLLLLLGALGFLALTVKEIMDVSQTLDWGISSLKDKIKAATAVDLSVSVAGLAIIIMAVFVYASIAVPAILVQLGQNVKTPTMQEGVRFYHPILYPLFIAALVFLPGYALGRYMDKRGLAGFLSTVAIASFIVALGVVKGDIVVLPNAPRTTSLLAGVGLTVSMLVGGALIVSIYLVLRRFKRIARKIGFATTVREFFTRLIHLAMIITFIGILISGTYSFNDSYFENYNLALGEPVEIGPYKVILEDYWFEPHNGSIDLAHIYGSFISISAWYGVKVFQLDLASALQQVENASRVISSNKTLELIVDRIVSNETYSAPQVINHNSTSTIQYVNVRTGPETLSTNINTIITVINPQITLFIEPVYNDQGSLIAGRLTPVIFAESASIKAPVEWTRYQLDVHSYYQVRLDEPINITLSNGDEIIIEELQIYPSTMGNQTVSATINGDTVNMTNAYLQVVSGRYLAGNKTYNIPYTLSTQILLYAMSERGDLPLLKDAVNSGLSQIATNNTLLEQAAGQNHGQLSLPRNAPSGATLYLRFKFIDDGGHSKEIVAKMRFEANGEASGIHGLVIPVVPVHKGVSDLYLAITPPYQTGYFGLYHEPLIYYLKVAQGKLPPQESLVLTAVMAAGYNIAEVSQQQPDQLGITVEKGIVDLYMLAENFNPDNSSIKYNGLAIRVKPVPGINIVWTGAILLGALGLTMSLVYTIMTRKRIEVRDELITLP